MAVAEFERVTDFQAERVEQARIGIGLAGGWRGRGMRLRAAVAAGTLATDQAAELLAALANAAAAIETDELQARIAALEEQANGAE